MGTRVIDAGEIKAQAEAISASITDEHTTEFLTGFSEGANLADHAGDNATIADVLAQLTESESLALNNGDPVQAAAFVVGGMCGAVESIELKRRSDV